MLVYQQAHWPRSQVLYLDIFCTSYRQILVDHAISLQLDRGATVEELREAIELLQRAEFNPAETDDDLHNES